MKQEHRITVPAEQAAIPAFARSRSAEWQNAAAVLVGHPEWSNEKVQKTAHTNLSNETMRLMRAICRVPKFCAYCGVEFVPTWRKFGQLGPGRDHHKYCSLDCQRKGKRQPRSERHQASLPKVTRKQLVLFQTDPQRETRLRLKFIVCRECGAKLKILSTRGRGSHLELVEKMTPEQYSEKWPGAPLVSIAFRDAVSYPWKGDTERRKKYSERRARFWVETKRVLAQHAPDPRITLAVCLEIQGLTKYEMKDQVYADLSYPDKSKQREARKARTSELFRRKPGEFERERNRLALLGETERLAVAEKARSQITARE